MCRSDYDSDSSNNDVCLLALARPPACADKFPLPSLASRVPSGGIQATAAGWGTNQGAEEARPLLEVSLLLHSTRDCLSMLGAGFHSPQMICAGTTGRDTCQGDSGGPLVVRSISPSGEDAFEQVGVVSWGYGCGRQGRPGAYANVANYRGWIEQMLRQRLPAPDASSSSLSSSSTSSARPHCRNTCEYASDGACDDGGPGSEFAACGVGSDCSDCGSSSSSTTTTLKEHLVYASDLVATLKVEEWEADEMIFIADLGGKEGEQGPPGIDISEFKAVVENWTKS
uniref:Peptidase S1 domain-containing protein n=1 Tax=Haptolina brevifila TaxID=156173 RepID=A0A7S2CHA0_9EUKA|mmetsp:Transcript_2491/g.5156  ORF Transcript_2491/g.5156 Transcript_2491/m.5156 type:complete len:284 (+) Transcript_2491:561-1412(+)